MRIFQAAGANRYFVAAVQMDFPLTAARTFQIGFDGHFVTGGKFKLRHAGSVHGNEKRYKKGKPKFKKTYMIQLQVNQWAPLIDKV